MHLIRKAGRGLGGLLQPRPPAERAGDGLVGRPRDEGEGLDEIAEEGLPAPLAGAPQARLQGQLVEAADRSDVARGKAHGRPWHRSRSRARALSMSSPVTAMSPFATTASAVYSPFRVE